MLFRTLEGILSRVLAPEKPLKVLPSANTVSMHLFSPKQTSKHAEQGQYPARSGKAYRLASRPSRCCRAACTDIC